MDLSTVIHSIRNEVTEDLGKIAQTALASRPNCDVKLAVKVNIDYNVISCLPFINLLHLYVTNVTNIQNN